MTTNITGSKFKRGIRKKSIEKYQDLIYKLAHRFEKTSGLEFEDLVGWGNLKFVECQRNYDPMLSSFGTYLYIQVTGIFTAMSQKELRYQSYKSESTEPVISNSNPEQETIFRDLLGRLSKDAKKVVKIIFETPIEIVDLFPKEKVNSQFRIHIYLRQQGWEWLRIMNAFEEIQESLAK